MARCKAEKKNKHDKRVHQHAAHATSVLWSMSIWALGTKGKEYVKNLSHCHEITILYWKKGVAIKRQQCSAMFIYKKLERLSSNEGHDCVKDWAAQSASVV